MAVQQKPTKLGESEVQQRLGEVPNWRREGGSITKKLKLKDFSRARAYADRVADKAEEVGHHPDIHVENFNEVRLVLSTHSVGGLSANDFEMAKAIDSIPSA